MNTLSKYEVKDFVDERHNRNSWGFLRKMNVGETVAIATGRMESYTMANRVGIKITVRKNRSTGDLDVTRLA